MSKDKLQKIWNEIKITYAKIQEIYSAPQISSTHQYLSLTPITNADEDNVYSNMLRFALSQNKTNNIAVTGPYGSGKLTKTTKHAKRHFWLTDVCTCHGLLPSHSA
jgi:DNA replication protein DnaC